MEGRAPCLLSGVSAPESSFQIFHSKATYKAQKQGREGGGREGVQAQNGAGGVPAKSPSLFSSSAFSLLHFSPSSRQRSCQCAVLFPFQRCQHKKCSHHEEGFDLDLAGEEEGKTKQVRRSGGSGKLGETPAGREVAGGRHAQK